MLIAVLEDGSSEADDCVGSLLSLLSKLKSIKKFDQI